MKKKILLAFLLTCFFALGVGSVFAQQRTDSNTVRTKVGNPKISNDTIKAGEDIKAAYDACEDGYTFEKSGLGECLRTQLSSLGYDSAMIDAFESKRQSSMADGCTQCLGFVREAMALVSGSSSDNLGGFGGASALTQLQSLTAGSIVFSRVPDGQPPEAGDIVAHDGGWGHAAIVKGINGNVNFTLLESNGEQTGDKPVCRATDYRAVNTDGYVFFRKN